MNITLHLHLLTCLKQDFLILKTEIIKIDTFPLLDPFFNLYILIGYTYCLAWTVLINYKWSNGTLQWSWAFRLIVCDLIICFFDVLSAIVLASSEVKVTCSVVDLLAIHRQLLPQFNIDRVIYIWESPWEHLPFKTSFYSESKGGPEISFNITAQFDFQMVNATYTDI